MQGRTVDDYDAPLFLAWQLTNRCSARCLACCEESGPDKAWRDELSRDEALAPRRRHRRCSASPSSPSAAASRSASPHCWDVFERLAAGGVALKLETDGSRIDADAADRIAALAVDCVQISVDGASAATHQRVRPGSSFAAAIGAIERLVARGCPPQFVFVPTRLNLSEIVAAFDLAAALGCSAFVTGPLMRIGRAAAAWDTLGLHRRRVAARRRGAARAGGSERRRSGAVDLPLGHRHRDARRGSRARRRCCWSCPTARSSSSTRCRSRPPTAPRLAARRLAGLSRRLAHDRGARLRAALPQRAGAAAPRQRDLGAAGRTPDERARPRGRRDPRARRPQVPARLATGEYMSTSCSRVLRSRSDTTPMRRSMKVRPNCGSACEAREQLIAFEGERRHGLERARLEVLAGMRQQRRPVEHVAGVEGLHAQHVARAPRARARPCPCRAGRTPNSRRPRERSPGPARNWTSLASAARRARSCGAKSETKGCALEGLQQAVAHRCSPAVGSRRPDALSGRRLEPRCSSRALRKPLAA